MTALVSVVIPCFNEEPFLAEAIESALEQTYPNVETIVVDDGSTDGSAAVAKQFGERVRVSSKTNGGLASARNLGIDVARGEFLTFLDGDDILRPDFVARTKALLDEDASIAFVYTQMELFGRESSVSTWPEYSLDALVHGNFISATALIRAEVFREVRFDERLRTGWEDWDFFLSLAERGYPGRRIDEPLFLYRKHDAQDRLSDRMVEAANKRKTRLAIMRRHLHLFGARRYSHYLAHHLKESARALAPRSARAREPLGDPE
jgi:glycosyltransferase involved in cell wall biosynthesis